MLELSVKQAKVARLMQRRAITHSTEASSIGASTKRTIAPAYGHAEYQYLLVPTVCAGLQVSAAGERLVWRACSHYYALPTCLPNAAKVRKLPLVSIDTIGPN